ncbi:hypothetical protein [Ekhidna sp.]|uniref:hypothetical protein n=1 Tax=Ekhidna sp. TaxID=2608089 RepID=UPI003B500A61
MKKISIIILCLVITTTINAQIKPLSTINELTANQFENIKLNGVTLKSIWDTSGNEDAIKNLFGEPTYINKQSEFADGVISREFYFDGIEMGFYNSFSSMGNLGGFKITSSTPSITINGITIKIGDNISKLGNVVITNMTTGGKSIVYSPDYDETTFLAIEFDESSGTIQEIIYYVLT